MDPKLFIQDLQFNKVPVRVYQPRAASDGRRRGIIFFHGGGWVFGSLGKIFSGGISDIERIFSSFYKIEIKGGFSM